MINVMIWMGSDWLETQREYMITDSISNFSILPLYQNSKSLLLNAYRTLHLNSNIGNLTTGSH